MPEIQNFSHVTYHGDGSTQIYNVPFEFIKRDYIYATIDGVDVDMSTVEWLTDTTIRFSTPPASDTIIVIYRDTDKSKPLVDFADGSVLTEKDLDDEVKHLLHITQESYDVPGRMRETIDDMNRKYNEIVTSKDNLIEEINQAGNNATNNIYSAENGVLQVLSENKEQAITDIDKAKQNTLESIATDISVISSVKDEAVQANEQAQNAMNISLQKAGQIQNLTVEAETLAYPNACTAEYNPDSGRLFLGITEGKPGKDGADGLPGQDGFNGKDGKDALPPAHIWDGTRLAFQNPDGTWGQSVDLRGEVGPQGQSPIIDVIDCGGACSFKLAQIDAGMACSFAN